jgi:hypothetical protein
MANQRRDSEHRPSPEALLEAARREESRVGKLRIFVGAAPGVGKTYEMLQQARARKKDGYDIVIGIVETHGRRDTEALLEGLETVPRRAPRIQRARSARIRRKTHKQDTRHRPVRGHVLRQNAEREHAGGGKVRCGGLCRTGTHREKSIGLLPPLSSGDQYCSEIHSVEDH